MSELVSVRCFPVLRENTGKFADFGLEIAKAPWLSEVNSIAYQQNSLAAKTGKNLRANREPEAHNSESDPNNGSRVWRPHHSSMPDMRLMPAGSFGQPP
jgi:hypothetical protein